MTVRLGTGYYVVPDHPGLEAQAPVSGHLMGTFQRRSAILPTSSAQTPRVDLLHLGASATPVQAMPGLPLVGNANLALLE